MKNKEKSPPYFWSGWYQSYMYKEQTGKLERSRMKKNSVLDKKRMNQKHPQT